MSDLSKPLRSGQHDARWRDQARRLIHADSAGSASGSRSNEMLVGGPGDDLLDGRGGTDCLFGLAGHDKLWGGTGNDFLSGGSGDDELRGGPGNDELHGGAGADAMHGDQGHDQLFGDGGDDRLFGGSGHDRLSGGDGDDHLAGESGRDWLSGGDGDDVLHGGAGADVLLGGTGSDTYVFGRGDGHDMLIEHSTAATDQDELRLREGIAADQLWFSRRGDTLQVSIVGRGDSMRLLSWYTPAAPRITAIVLDCGRRLAADKVEPLVQAMAGFAPPPPGSSHWPAPTTATLTPLLSSQWR